MGCKDFYLDVYFIDIGEEILNSIFIFYIMKHHKALPLKQLRSNWTDIHHMVWPMANHKVSDYFVYGIIIHKRATIIYHRINSTPQNSTDEYLETQVKCPIAMHGRYPTWCIEFTILPLNVLNHFQATGLAKRISEAVTKADTNHSLNLSTYFKYL